MEMLKISPQFCINCPSGQAAANARRGAPGGNAHGGFQQIVTAPPAPGIGGQCPQPISHAGVPPVAMRTVAFSNSLLP